MIVCRVSNRELKQYRGSFYSIESSSDGSLKLSLDVMHVFAHLLLITCCFL